MYIIMMLLSKWKEDVIGDLHWGEFHILVDIIFMRNIKYYTVKFNVRGLWQNLHNYGCITMVCIILMMEIFRGNWYAVASESMQAADYGMEWENIPTLTTTWYQPITSWPVNISVVCTGTFKFYTIYVAGIISMAASTNAVTVRAK